MLNPFSFIYFIVAILAGLTIHEASHATIADILGDPTAKRMGRVTLNPIKHLDPAGTLMMVFAAIFGIGIGWGKPCPVNPNNLRPNPKTGYALVAAAGPVSNLLLAILLVALTGYISLHATTLPSLTVPGGQLSLATLIQTMLLVNVSLALFNLIPIPPLDGFNVLLGLLPAGPSTSLSKLYQFGPGLLLLLIFFGSSLLGAYFNWGFRVFDTYLGVPIMSAFGLQ